MIQGSPAELVRPELRRLTAYTLHQVESWKHKIDQNEVPFDFPRRLKAEVLRRLREPQLRWTVYPDFNGDELRAAVARHHGWSPEGVLVGGGSSELLSLSVECLCPPGGEVITHVPSFGLYKMLVPRSGAVACEVEPGEDLLIPYQGLLAEVRKNPQRPLMLCSPNNPVGDAISLEQMEELLQVLEAPLLLDGAYAEFCQYDYRSLLHTYPHLLFYGTMSKAWGVAGMRIGFVLAHPELVAELVKAKLPYNLDHAALATGLVALENPTISRRAVAAIVGRRPQWNALLEEAGFETFPSETNFVLARCCSVDASAEEAAAAKDRVLHGLGDRGILVRDVSRGHGLAGCLRFTIGSGAALRDTRIALAEMGYLDADSGGGT
ncbi:MAG: histidinol-phosphate transaminase [Acidobacteriota bacterium]